MRATLIAAGSRGDVQPYVALGTGLRRAGHTVRVLASPDFRELITSHDLEFFDLGGSIQSVAQGMEGLLEGGNLLKILSSMGPAAQRLVSEAAVSGMAACRGSDVIIAGLGGLFVGLAISEKMGIAFVPAYLYPFTPTREFGSVLSPLPPARIPGWANRLSHRLAQQMMWQTFRPADTQARREVLGIAPAPFWGPFASLERGDRTILCGYSRHVVPIPADWAECIHVTGYWYLEPSRNWEPPDDLMDFLASGPPPVYVGFGSMVNRWPEEVGEMVLRATEDAGQRAILSSGWGGLAGRTLPATIFMAGSIPHSWLFPKMAAVVHHGGVGTTAAGLRAGIPSIIVPYFGDQPFWGQRVAALGVGPQPIPRARLTAERLARAVRTAVGDVPMRERAARFGAAIRAEDGISHAVCIIERFVTGGPS